jgi:hypothetical protein
MGGAPQPQIDQLVTLKGRPEWGPGRILAIQGSRQVIYPNYLRPNSAISRTLAVVYAVLKFLYIGIFVSFFVEEARARA